MAYDPFQGYTGQNATDVAKLRLAQALATQGPRGHAYKSGAGANILSEALSKGMAGYMIGQQGVQADERQKAMTDTMSRAMSAGQGAPAGFDAQTGINWDTARPGNQQMMAQILSGNRDTAPMAMGMQLQEMQNKAALDKALALERAKNAGEPPKTRTVERNGVKVTEEWDPATRSFTEIASSPPDWQNPGYIDAQKQIRAAGKADTSITIGGDTKTDTALRKQLSEDEGKRWSKLKESGTVSASLGQDFQALDELMKVAPQGPISGRLAEAFPGFSSAGDAFQSVVVRVAPTLRTPGSGATSDIEYEGMLKSLPRLRNHPDANRAISEMMKAKASLNVERSQIVTAYENEQIDAKTARARLEELNKRSIMSPELKAALDKVGGDQPKVPKAGDVMDGYRFKGGDPSKSTSWEKVI